MSSATPSDAGPVTGRNRIVELDVLRGFALLGILLVNVAFFANPVSDPFNFTGTGSNTDLLIGWIVGFVAQGKFYPLFSLLFGLGFAVQLERVSRLRRSFLPIYLRRLLMLLAIGVLHGTLIWAGDILTVYALLGFLLLLVGRGNTRWLLGLAIVAFVLQVMLVLAMSWSLQTAAECRVPVDVPELEAPSHCQSEGMQNMLAGLAEAQAESDRLQEAARNAYTGGGFLEVTRVRVQEFSVMLSNMSFFGAEVLAMFLFGAWLGRNGYFTNPERHLGFFRNALILAVVVGLPLSGWFAGINLRIDYTNMYDPRIAQAFLVNLFAGPLMAVGYASVIVLVLRTRAGRQLTHLAPVGRMALTNYLAQSLLGTLIFYSYGFGLMASEPGMPLQLAIVLGIFLLQVFWSHWWMQRFRFGPAEWLWRTATYLRTP